MRGQLEPQRRLGGDVGGAELDWRARTPRRQLSRLGSVVAPRAAARAPARPAPAPAAGPAGRARARRRGGRRPRRRPPTGRLGGGPPAVVDGLVDGAERHGGGEVAGQLGEHGRRSASWTSSMRVGEREVVAPSRERRDRRLDRVADEGVLEPVDQRRGRHRREQAAATSSPTGASSSSPERSAASASTCRSIALPGEGGDLDQRAGPAAKAGEAGGDDLADAVGHAPTPCRAMHDPPSPCVRPRPLPTRWRHSSHEVEHVATAARRAARRPGPRSRHRADGRSPRPRSVRRRHRRGRRAAAGSTPSTRRRSARQLASGSVISSPVSRNVPTTSSPAGSAGAGEVAQ